MELSEKLWQSDQDGQHNPHHSVQSQYLEALLRSSQDDILKPTSGKTGKGKSKHERMVYERGIRKSCWHQYVRLEVAPPSMTSQENHRHDRPSYTITNDRKFADNVRAQTTLKAASSRNIVQRFVTERGIGFWKPKPRACTTKHKRYRSIWNLNLFENGTAQA